MTAEDGSVLPMFHPGYLDRYTKGRKALLGAEVWDIFTTSSDPEELETKLVAAYEKAKDAVDKKTAMVEKHGEGKV